MRSVGLTHFGYRRQLQDWMDLSIQKNVPISLLIMSRAFTINSKVFHPEEVLRSSISSLTDDTINEVVLAAAADNEDLKDLRKRKLESLQFQQELIEEETSETAAKPAVSKPDAPLPTDQTVNVADTSKPPVDEKKETKKV
jgi:LETM1 and EF-hand domain-containing protein 1, mitochondrial